MDTPESTASTDNWPFEHADSGSQTPAPGESVVFNDPVPDPGQPNDDPPTTEPFAPPLQGEPFAPPTEAAPVDPGVPEAPQEAPNEGEAVPTAPAEDGGPATDTPTEAEEATVRRGRGDLETDVKNVTDKYVSGEYQLEGGHPLTPHRVAQAIKELDSLDKPPSPGAVSEVFKRWKEMGFGEFTEKPFAFTGYTQEALNAGGLTAMKSRWTERKAADRKAAREAEKARQAAEAPATPDTPSTPEAVADPPGDPVGTVGGDPVNSGVETSTDPSSQPTNI